MNAHTPALTPLALEHAVLVRALHAQDFKTKAELCERFGRDKSNLNKTLKRLEAEGLVDFEATKLTPAGANAVRELEGLAGKVDAPPATSGVAEIELALIDTDPVLNPRTDFAPGPLEALAQSIRDKGVAQPILLRPGLEPGRWRVVAGERRTRAARIAELVAIPALIRDLDDDQALEIATIENIQREDLNPIEEANAFRRILDAKLRLHPELSAKDAKQIIADATKKTVRYVEQRVDLLLLPAALQKRAAIPRGEHGHLKLEDARYEVQKIRSAEQRTRERVLPRDQLLLMAELYMKVDKDPAKLKNWWSNGKPTEVRYDVDEKAKPLATLVGKQRITIRRNWQDDGRTYAYVDSWAFTKADVAGQLPGFGSSKRAQAIHDLRVEVLGAERADQLRADGLYATAWLNGPFEPDPDLAEKAKRKSAAEKAAETKAAKARAADEATLARVYDEMRRAIAEGGVEGETLAELLTAVDLPTPWRMDRGGNVMAANGKEVIRDTWNLNYQREPRIYAQRELLAFMVNFTAGAPFSIEPDAPGAPAPEHVGDDEDEASDDEAGQ